MLGKLSRFKTWDQCCTFKNYHIRVLLAKAVSVILLYSIARKILQDGWFN